MEMGWKVLTSFAITQKGRLFLQWQTQQQLSSDFQLSLRGLSQKIRTSYSLKQLS